MQISCQKGQIWILANTEDISVLRIRINIIRVRIHFTFFVCSDHNRMNADPQPQTKESPTRKRIRQDS
jgi:hypothetical protein